MNTNDTTTAAPVSFLCSECEDTLPDSVRVYPARLSGTPVAECGDCGHLWAYWECGCDFEHPCACAECGDAMDTRVSNLYPTWSDLHDANVCRWCFDRVPTSVRTFSGVELEMTSAQASRFDDLSPVAAAMTSGGEMVLVTDTTWPQHENDLFEASVFDASGDWVDGGPGFATVAAALAPALHAA